ncbi:3-keto-5-aminohexanoate cleavage protein [Alkalihalobacterium alkalinitrilicum]|uniref:3-keto-5-aminohexanoate cleavage protein n=1 Tax=Alkalihalobacterium alkalinitrilicum TaxID=427920 RepID=UPI0009957E6E|nr:3-keto-5-aminohexanoate cleavage protein [Alkalihalobacterium alkalinitrilicum]
MNRKVWLEAALNGPWTRNRQPNIPIQPSDIINQAVECANAGASIIHFHAYDVSTGRETIDVETNIRIIEGIKSQLDVIVYPLVNMISQSDAVGIEAGNMRYEHMRKLAKYGLMEWMVLDPGSCNISLLNDLSNANTIDASVYINSDASTVTGLELAAEYGIHSSYAIYEPGFVRAGSALARAIRNTPPPIYRFMFTNQFSFGYPPSKQALDAYLELLKSVSPGSPWMIAGLGVDIWSLIPRAVELGGHVRVGLEDAILGTDDNNRKMVKKAAALIKEAGGTIATAADVRSMLTKM